MKTHRLTAFGVVLLAGVVSAQPWSGGIRSDGKTVGMGTKDNRTQGVLDKRQAFASAMIAARGHIKAKRWLPARETAMGAALTVTTPEDLKVLQEILIRLDAEGQSQLKDAEELYQGKKYPEALRGFRRVAFNFGNMPCGKQARARLKALSNDPALRTHALEIRASLIDGRIERMITGYYKAKARAAGQKAKPKPKTKTDPAEATKPPMDKLGMSAVAMPADRVDRIKGLDPLKQAQVVTLLQQIIKAYGDSPTGQRARQDYQTLLLDRTFVETVARIKGAQDVKRAYSKAESYRKAGMRKKAVLLYQDVVKRYPDTPEAEKAAQQVVLLQTQEEAP